MSDHEPRIEETRLLGERLCLDFINTIENRAGSHRHDFLRSYGDLVTWAVHAGAISAEEGALLRDNAGDDEANSVWEQACALRETLHAIFDAIATDSAIPPEAMQRLRATYAEAIAQGELISTERHYLWEWPVDSGDLRAPLWPIAHSAIELLTSGDRHRIKRCASAQGCGWLFYDTSKNGSRRWCRMDGCGAQHKMRALHARRRAARQELDS
jgi:predicted RNA-binding Zn ribbon-like protein